MTKARDSQLSLKLDRSAPEPASRWHDGATLAFLGGGVRLVLGTPHGEAWHEGDTLHLPLPPESTPRQIQDRAEAWLREEATRRLQAVIEEKFLEGRTALALAGRRPPRLALSFAARGHWVEVDGRDALRCNWRLIEQAMPLIEQAIARAIASLPSESADLDLFGSPLATG